MGARQTVGLALWLTALARFAAGQAAIQPRPRPAAAAPERPTANLRVDANLVLAPVTVCDPLNRPITGLEKENFLIFDDDLPQTITQFSMDDEPAAVGLIFDVSGSMGSKLARSRDAAAAFFRTVNLEDEFFLIEFDSSPRVIVPLTRNPGAIMGELTFTKSHGQTALVDAVILGLHELKKSKLSRKAVLVISDGGENNSRYTDGELKSMIREADALVYGIGIYGNRSSREEYAGPEFLRGMAEQSGGHVLAGTAAELPDIAWRIGVELRNRYVLGFSPASQPRDGRYHRLEVKVVPPRGLPKLTAHWRRGYYAPAD